jgi:hypothetical protein
MRVSDVLLPDLRAGGINAIGLSAVNLKQPPHLPSISRK